MLNSFVPQAFTAAQLAVLERIESIPDYFAEALGSAHSAIFFDSGSNAGDTVSPIFEDKLLYPKLKQSKSWKFDGKLNDCASLSNSAASAAVPTASNDESQQKDTGGATFAPNEVFRWETKSSTACGRFIEELKHLQATITHLHIQMNLVGVDLRLFGLLPTFATQVAADLAKKLPQNQLPTCSELKPVHCYAVYYKADGSLVESHHPVHADDSDLTLNLCLGTNDFEGGDLFFINQSTALESVALKQTPGVAIVHPGSMIHGSRPLTKGERYNLIVWFKWMPRFEQFPLLPTEVQQRVFHFVNGPAELGRMARASKFYNRLLCQMSMSNESIDNGTCLIWDLMTAKISGKPLVSPQESNCGPEYARLQCHAALDHRNKTSGARQKKERRKLIADEMKQTEATYISYLEKLLTTMQPLFTKMKMQPEDSRALFRTFQSLSQIVRIQKALLKLFDILSKSSGDVDHFPLYFSLLKQLIPLFVTYVPYVASYEDTTQRIKRLAAQLKDQQPKLHKELVEAEKGLGMELAGLLIMPVRRIPRYSLLFGDLNRHSSEVSQVNTKLVTDQLQLMSQYMNSGKRLQTFIELICKETNLPLVDPRHPLRQQQHYRFICGGSAKLTIRVSANLVVKDWPVAVIICDSLVAITLPPAQNKKHNPVRLIVALTPKSINTPAPDRFELADHADRLYTLESDDAALLAGMNQIAVVPTNSGFEQELIYFDEGLLHAKEGDKNPESDAGSSSSKPSGCSVC